MGTGLRLLLTVILCAGISAAYAQKTAEFWDPAREYKEALDIFDQQKYNIAYNRFHSFIQRYEQEDVTKSDLLLADAHYYMANCALQQEDPKAESFYLAYIDRFKGHSLNNVAYYDLGNLYFDGRDYRAALEYYNRVDEKALNRRYYEEFSFKRGFCYFSLKEFRTARLSWHDILNRPDSDYYADANYYYGMAAYYEEDYEAAISAFDRVDDDPRYRNVVPYYIAQIRFINGDYPGVIAYAEPLVQRSGMRYKPDMHQLIGQSYFEQKDYANAVIHLTEYERKASTVSMEDYYQLGYAQYHIGDYEGAVASFRKLNHLNNKLAQNALFLTANAYLKIGDKENARTALNRAASMNFDPAITEEAKFNYAKLSYELGFNNDALVSLRRFINDYPNSAFIDGANEILADLLLQTRNFDEALSIIESIQNPSPKITRAYQVMSYHKGISLYNEGRLNPALDAFNKALRYTPDEYIKALTRYWIGDIYHRKGEYGKSITNVDHFLASSARADAGFNTKVDKSTGHYVQGYNYYKQGEYADAREHFRQASEGFRAGGNAEIRNSLLPDALLRTADCYYLARQYDAAAGYYNRVVDRGYDGADYAIFQKAAIEGIRGNYSRQIDLLKSVQTTYPQSVLADDALYEAGNTYILIENDARALETFNRVGTEYPKSEWVGPSYLKMGLIYFNRDQYDDALRQYKKVVSEYPKTTTSAEALIAVKDVYIAMGDPQAYIRYLESIPGASVTVSEQDSILYLSAENLFTRGDYEKALSAFNEYLLRFPNGYFSLPAHFYRGECHFSFEDLDQAIADYRTVLKTPNSRFTERSLQRAAGINYYHLRDYDAALEQYTELIRTATTEDNRRLATLGILRCNFQLERYAATIEYADRVANDPVYAEMQRTEAYFYRARAQWETGSRSRAVADYTEVRDRVTNEWAAEGAYYTALDHFEAGRLDAAEEACFEFAREYPSYASWLVRTYVLLADIYIKRGNLFKARSTIQSVLDNYSRDDEWRALAEAKYAEIERLETEGSKIDTGGEGNEMKFDE